jgi:hypothetical protein
MSRTAHRTRTPGGPSPKMRPSARGEARENARQWEYTRMQRMARFARHCDGSCGCAYVSEAIPVTIGCAEGKAIADLVSQAAYFVNYWSDQAIPEPTGQPRLF